MAGMDQLPENILQKILLLLTWEDAAHMSVLSKKWKALWAKSPVYYISLVQEFPEGGLLLCHEPILKLHEETEDFINAVDEGFQDIRSEKAMIQKFRLCMFLIDSKILSHIDDWIGFSAENCLRELDLNMYGHIRELHPEIRNHMPKVWYSLPPKIFAAKSLEVLSLKGCKLEKPLFAATRTQLCSLREVSLVDVCLDDKVLQDFMFCCPALEDFALSDCVGLKILRIPFLLKLKRLTVYHTETFQRINIEAIHLQSFRYRGLDGMLNISIPTLKYLRELNIESAQITDDLFEDLMSKLLLLNNLELIDCFGMMKIKISHIFLEKLCLCLKNSLLVLEINIPSLVFFEYGAADRLPDRFLINAPSLQGSHLRIDTNFSLCIDTHWFRNLRVYLSKLASQNRIVMISFRRQFEKATFIPGEFINIAIPPLPVVEQLELETFGNVFCWKSTKALLDGFLWSCHPEILVTGYHGFITFLLEKLIEDPVCCIDNQIRCWRHYIKDFRIQSLTTVEDRRGPGACQKISFELKWDF